MAHDLGERTTIGDFSVTVARGERATASAGGAEVDCLDDLAMFCVT